VVDAVCPNAGVAGSSKLAAAIPVASTAASLKLAAADAIDRAWWQNLLRCGWLNATLISFYLLELN